MTREEIDAAIARHAETETLFDRPYEDTQGRPRVGPVHRREPVAPSRQRRRPRGCRGRRGDPGRVDAGRFIGSILDNLRRAGVQNTKREERLEFLPPRPVPGRLRPGSRGVHRDRRRPGPSRSPSAPSSAPSAPSSSATPPRRPCKFARPARRVRLRLRPAGGGGGQHPRPPHDPPGAHEPGPRDGGRAPQEDRHRQPVHGLRRARHRRPPGGGRPDPGGNPRPRRLRPDHRRAPLRPRSTTSPAWFLDTNYDGDASSSATPTSRAPTTRTTSSAARSAPTSATRPGPTINSTVSAARSRARTQARSP